VRSSIVVRFDSEGVAPTAGPALQSAVADYAATRDYADEYHVDVQCQGNSLVFNGALEGQWNILKLPDEAGTLGPVSGEKYEAAAKVEI